ncbi:methyl-accepting chemotaxis protein [Dactylosporangium sp. NPDC051485]|uniref:methyl-accepting chemotaxis protein n=1 Tax=Dactylosporangium sp. NPDC051485 TaxID=3154846 RepID=UPI003443CC95
MQTETASRAERPGTSIWHSLGARIVGLVTLALLAAVLIGVVGVVTVGAVNARTDRMYHSNVVPAQQLDQVRADMKDARIAQLNYVVANTAEGMATQLAAFNEAVTAFDADVAAYRATTADPATLDKLVTAWHGYLEVARILMPYGINNDWDSYHRERVKAVPFADEADRMLVKLLDTERADAAHGLAAADQLYRQRRVWMVATIVVAIGLTAVLSTLLIRGIIRRLRRVVTAMGAVAAGDLTTVSSVGGSDEIAKLGNALDATVASLRQTVAGVTRTAGGVAGAARELHGTTQQLAQIAERSASDATTVSTASDEVARSIQTLAAAAEQMNASIADIARSAHEAAGVASGAVHTAQTTQGTMSALGESGQQIGQVLAVIRSIAEQTNLLALNATIEAARAGDAGKGFAVVAGEVKELALETANATTDISGRVETIQIDTGNALSAIGAISQVIGKINEYQMTIASAVEEQTATTGQMTRSVSSAAEGVDGISTRVATVAESAEATAGAVVDAQARVDQLNGMAAELHSLVAQFRT